MSSLWSYIKAKYDRQWNKVSVWDNGWELVNVQSGLFTCLSLVYTHIYKAKPNIILKICTFRSLFTPGINFSFNKWTWKWILTKLNLVKLVETVYISYQGSLFSSDPHTLLLWGYLWSHFSELSKTFAVNCKMYVHWKIQTCVGLNLHIAVSGPLPYIIVKPLLSMKTPVIPQSRSVRAAPAGPVPCCPGLRVEL